MIQSEFIRIFSIKTPIGNMIAGATEQGICLLEFEDSGRAEEDIITLFVGKSCRIIYESDTKLDLLSSQVESYFNGKLRNFEVRLHTHGTTYQQKIWNLIRKIPYGDTITYKILSGHLNPTGSPRAAASATASNRLALIIPCHRVVGSDGSLTGYSGGLARKKWLLDFERFQTGKPSQLNIGW